MKDLINGFRFMEIIYRGICLDEVEELKKSQNVPDISDLLNREVEFNFKLNRELVSDSKIAAGYSLSWYRSGIVVATRFNPFKFKYMGVHLDEGHRFYIVPKDVDTKVKLLDAKSMLSVQDYEEHMRIASITPRELGHSHRKYT